MTTKTQDPMNEPDIIPAEGLDRAPAPPAHDGHLAPVEVPAQEMVLHAGIATLALTPEQTAIIRAPIAAAEIDFRWGDKAKTYALAYAPQVMVRRRLCEAFPGQWGLRVLRAFTSEEDGGAKVLLHGALYIQGRFVAESMGEAAYLGDVNKGSSYATAWESAKSDCLGRCCKDLGMFAELWDRKFTKPLERAWIKSNKKKCPKCGEIDAFTQKKDDDSVWFCWKNPSRGKNGCGWEGVPPEEEVDARAGNVETSVGTKEEPAPRPAPAPDRSPSGAQSRKSNPTPARAPAPPVVGVETTDEIGARIQASLKAREEGKPLAEIAGKKPPQARGDAATQIAWTGALERLKNCAEYAGEKGLLCADKLRNNQEATLRWAAKERTVAEYQETTVKIVKMLETLEAEFPELRNADIPF